MHYLARALALLLILMTSLASADDITFTWLPNTESDLAGYKLYQSTVSGQYGAPAATLGKVTTGTLTLPQLEVDTTYFFTLTAYDLAGNESPKSAEISRLVAGVPVKVAPGVPLLTVTAITPTGFNVSWPPVSDGAGGTAKVDVRLGSPTDHWGLMVSQACASSPCSITGLTNGTTYQVGAVAYRVEPTGNAFGPLSVMLPVTTTLLDLPPAAPTGFALQVARTHEGDVVVTAKVSDCRRVTTSTMGSTTLVSRRTIRCVK